MELRLTPDPTNKDFINVTVNGDLDNGILYLTSTQNWQQRIYMNLVEGNLWKASLYTKDWINLIVDYIREVVGYIPPSSGKKYFGGPRKEFVGKDKDYFEYLNINITVDDPWVNDGNLIWTLNYWVANDKCLPSDFPQLFWKREVRCEKRHHKRVDIVNERLELPTGDVINCVMNDDSHYQFDCTTEELCNFLNCLQNQKQG